jgi:hypothetical protein
VLTFPENDLDKTAMKKATGSLLPIMEHTGRKTLHKKGEIFGIDMGSKIELSPPAPHGEIANPTA